MSRGQVSCLHPPPNEKYAEETAEALTARVRSGRGSGARPDDSAGGRLRAAWEATRPETQDPEDPPVEPLHPRVRQVVRRRLHEAVGGEELHGRDRRSHGVHGGRSPRGRGSVGAKGARPLSLPVAAGGLRSAGDRSAPRDRAGREEAREDDPARRALDPESEDREVLRVLRLLRPGSRELPDRSLGEGRLSKRAGYLGRPAQSAVARSRSSSGTRSGSGSPRRSTRTWRCAACCGRSAARSRTRRATLRSTRRGRSRP